MSSKPLYRLLSYMRPYKTQYRRATTYSLLNKIFDIAPEILIGVAVDTVVKQQHSWLAAIGFVSVKQQLVVLGLLTFITWALESLFQYLYSVEWRNLAQSVQHALRLETYAHVQNLDMATFEKESTGNLLSILNDDVNQLERFLEDGVNQIIQVIASSAIIGAIFFVLAPSIALLAVVPIPFIIWGAFFFQSKLAPRFLEVRKKAGAVGARLSNNITGIFTIKSFTAQDYELEQVEKESEAYREANRQAIKWSAMVTPVIRIAILVGFLATLVYGGFLTVEGTLSVGVYSVLIFLTQRLLWPLTRLAEITIDYQRSMASTTRVLDLLNTPIQITPHGTALPTKDVKGTINFNHVEFGYELNHPVIHDFSVNIHEGATVAFVGTTGSGKTTLMKLLLRFYHPNSGQIRLDGRDISAIDLQDLRKSIGIVSQDVFLFQGTVSENIAYAMKNTSEQEIEKAAKMAEAHEFIMKLPQGYATIVGERGQKLSNGQRQRLAIARAILKDPPVLILDEATSAVDNETEMAIQRSLEKIIVGRTTLMIAHRLSTVRHANQIFVMQHGRIAEKGNHEELLKQGGIYTALWHLQIGQSIDEVLLHDQGD